MTRPGDEGSAPTNVSSLFQMQKKEEVVVVVIRGKEKEKGYRRARQDTCLT
jgi:hypothetical protein